MHAAGGMTIANERTCAHLRAFRDSIRSQGDAAFLAMDETIRREYSSGQPVTVTLPDMVFAGCLQLDPGGCPVCLIQAGDGPHTDDATLVFLPTQRMLFVGDAISGVFPSWERDPRLARRLADTLSRYDADTCIGSHWEPEPLRDTIADLLRDTAPD